MSLETQLILGVATPDVAVKAEFAGEDGMSGRRVRIGRIRRRGQTSSPRRPGPSTAANDLASLIWTARPY